jgi:hypothetical protein
MVRARRARPAGCAGSQCCAWGLRNGNTARDKGSYRALLGRFLPRSAVSQRGRKSNGNPSGA